MSLYQTTNSGNTPVKLGATLLLFLGASLIDLKLSSLTIYPIYLVSILYASLNFSFLASLPLSAIAAYLSIQNEGTDTASFINTFLVKFTVLLIISYLFSAYIGLIKTYRLRFDLLKTMIPQCPDCGAILCNDGKWRSLKEITGSPDLLGALPKHDCEIKSQTPFRNQEHQ